MPPTLGLFMDTPWHQVTTAQVKAIARAGFLWVVADGEVSLVYTCTAFIRVR